MSEVLEFTSGRSPARACTRSSFASPKSVTEDRYCGSLSRARCSASCNVIVTGAPCICPTGACSEETCVACAKPFAVDAVRTRLKITRVSIWERRFASNHPLRRPSITVHLQSEKQPFDSQTINWQHFVPHSGTTSACPLVLQFREERRSDETCASASTIGLGPFWNCSGYHAISESHLKAQHRPRTIARTST